MYILYGMLLFLAVSDVVSPFEARQQLYVPPDLTFTSSTWGLHSVYVF
jgi:hypothetical protein